MRSFIFDLDGVLYRGEEPVYGAVEAVNLLADSSMVTYLTNNSSLHRNSYARRLTDLGYPATPSDIMSSAYGAALYVSEHRPNARVMVIGETGLVEEIEDAGLTVATERVEVVVVGIDRQFSYANLKLAQTAIVAGAQFIATNRDATYPIAGGGIEPGAGSIVAAVATASGAEPFTIGKPKPMLFDQLIERHRLVRPIVVGDRLDTDILGGNRAGLETVLVLTGVSTRADVESAPAEMKPDRIINDLRELL